MGLFGQDFLKTKYVIFFFSCCFNIRGRISWCVCKAANAILVTAGRARPCSMEQMIQVRNDGTKAALLENINITKSTFNRTKVITTEREKLTPRVHSENKRYLKI